MEDVIECDYCGGDSYFMGATGNSCHFRCRHCGGDMILNDRGYDFGDFEEDDILSIEDEEIANYIDVFWRPE